MAKSVLFSLVVAGLLSACGTTNQSSGSSTANTLSSKEQKEGWTLLFDGTTKTGWHVFNNRSDGSAWKVENGALYLDPKAKGPRGAGGGDLISEQEFENFHFKIDWKLDSAGNSGIIFQAKEDPKYRYAWVTGPEMQIIDNNAHPDAKNNKHRAGDLYDLVAASPEVAKPIGEWNTMEILADRGKLELFLNGKKVVSTIQWDDNWKQMIANSKFKTANEFGIYKKGKISLQDHGDLVWFRNIKIKQL